MLAGAAECVDEVRTLPVIRTDLVSTLINVNLTIDARETSIAFARVLVEPVHALTAARARLSFTLVDVCFAVGSCPPCITLANKCIDSVDAFPIAAIGPCTLIHVGLAIFALPPRIAVAPVRVD